MHTMKRASATLAFDRSIERSAALQPVQLQFRLEQLQQLRHDAGGVKAPPYVTQRLAGQRQQDLRADSHRGGQVLKIP